MKSNTVLSHIKAEGYHNKITNPWSHYACNPSSLHLNMDHIPHTHFLTACQSSRVNYRGDDVNACQSLWRSVSCLGWGVAVSSVTAVFLVMGIRLSVYRPLRVTERPWPLTLCTLDVLRVSFCLLVCLATFPSLICLLCFWAGWCL